MPQIVALLSLAVAVTAWIVLRRTRAAGGAMEWHFAFLGTGFMLMEVQIISKLALLVPPSSGRRGAASSATA